MSRERSSGGLRKRRIHISYEKAMDILTHLVEEANCPHHISLGDRDTSRSLSYAIFWTGISEALLDLPVRIHNDLMGVIMNSMRGDNSGCNDYVPFMDDYRTTGERLLRIQSEREKRWNHAEYDIRKLRNDICSWVMPYAEFSEKYRLIGGEPLGKTWIQLLENRPAAVMALAAYFEIMASKILPFIEKVTLHDFAETWFPDRTMDKEEAGKIFHLRIRLRIKLYQLAVERLEALSHSSDKEETIMR